MAAPPEITIKVRVEVEPVLTEKVAGGVDQHGRQMEMVSRSWLEEQANKAARRSAESSITAAQFWDGQHRAYTEVLDRLWPDR